MRLALFLILAVLAAGYAYWVYMRVELAVRAGRRLAALRAASLLLILLLLFDPRLPGGLAVGSSSRWVLLDVSLSMAEAWPDAWARAAELEGDGWTVVGFGDGLVGMDTSGDTREPLALRTLLSEALERAAEAGVGEVAVLSDLRFEDPVQVRAAIASLPMDVSFEAMGTASVNAGVGNLHVPDALRPSEVRVATMDVYGSGADSVDLEVREEGRWVAALRLALPAPGFRQPVEIELPPPGGEGRLRYTASVTIPGDGFSSDDTAVDYATVGHEEGALVLLSLRPDWEVRYLLPVLQQVTGLSARGYLRVGPDRFASMGRAVDRTTTLDSAAVRAAVGDAAFLVIHGVEGGVDPWARALVQRAGGRTLFFPVDARGADLIGVSTAASRDGEWYAAQDLPASPLAGELAGVRLQGLPPLTGVLPLGGGVDGEVPLRLQLAGMGNGEAALLLRRTRRGRQAVALASGFWRWAARAGEGRGAYRSLWSGVAGWLLAEDGAGPSQEPRPTKWVYERGEGAAFRLPGDSTVSLRVQIDRDGVVVLDSTFSAGGTADIGTLEPGLYAYQVLDGAGGVVSAGRFDVATRTDEMLPARFVAEEGEGTPGTRGVTESRGRPLRTMWWPYLLIIALLCMEWVARRRAGLR